jgi:hypothetical protein
MVLYNKTTWLFILLAHTRGRTWWNRKNYWSIICNYTRGRWYTSIYRFLTKICLPRGASPVGSDLWKFMYVSHPVGRIGGKKWRIRWRWGPYSRTACWRRSENSQLAFGSGDSPFLADEEAVKTRDSRSELTLQKNAKLVTLRSLFLSLSMEGGPLTWAVS